MKIKNKVFLASAILTFGFFGFLNLAQAADFCCVVECMIATGPTDTCVPSYDTPQVGNCITDFGCPAVTPPASSDSATITFPNPIAHNTVDELLTSLLANLRGIIVIIAVIFIVIGGIMYITSGGSEKMTTLAKKTITSAMIGLAIALAAPSFLDEILKILGNAPEAGDITLKEIAMNILNFLLSILGVLGIISTVIGGGMYLTSYGDEKRIELSKKIITYSIIGIIAALSSLVIVRQINNLITAVGS